MIRFMTTLFVTACTVIMLVAFPSTTHASDFDKLMLLTFNQPVSLPHVTLPAGTYRFELADPAVDSTLVRVTSENGATLYGMFMTIAENSADAPANPVTLEKRHGTAEAITAWFYPGDGIGREFIYPQEEHVRG